MAKLQLFSLFDRKLREYGHVLMEKNTEGMTRRLMLDIQPGSMIAKYPEDFDLYMVAEFDSETGVVTAELPSFLLNVSVVLGDSNIKGGEDAVSSQER